MVYHRWSALDPRCCMAAVWLLHEAKAGVSLGSMLEVEVSSRRDAGGLCVTPLLGLATTIRWMLLVLLDFFTTSQACFDAVNNIACSVGHDRPFV